MTIRTLACLVLAAGLAVGCGDDGNEKGSNDAPNGVTTDAGVSDSGDDAAVGPGDAMFDLAITFGGQTAQFERAYYGVTSPRNSTRDRWEIYIEAYAGGADGCPTEGAPTPDQTLIVAGVSFPDDAEVTTDADGLAVSFLDFSGELSTAPLDSARGEQTTVVSANVCRECDSEPDGFVVLDLDAPFTLEAASAEGEAVGRLIATHCPSLDAR